mgnify:CR=1 FL=1
MQLFDTVKCCTSQWWPPHTAHQAQHVELGGGCGHTVHRLYSLQAAVSRKQSSTATVSQKHIHIQFTKHNKLDNIKKDQRAEVRGSTGTTCKTYLSNNYIFSSYGVKTTAENNAWDRHRNTKWFIWSSQSNAHGWQATPPPPHTYFQHQCVCKKWLIF